MEYSHRGTIFVDYFHYTKWVINTVLWYILSSSPKKISREKSGGSNVMQFVE